MNNMPTAGMHKYRVLAQTPNNQIFYTEKLNIYHF